MAKIKRIVERAQDGTILSRVDFTRPAPIENRKSKIAKLPRTAGLGDVVERVAKPIAQVVDRATAKLPARLRTRLAGCSACSKRRAWLNRLVPDVRRPWRRK